jgi:drug/metabolite transporter (DMT)-like permease
MNPTLGTLSALTAALIWGVGDFSGGLAARRQNHYQVLYISIWGSLAVLIACSLVWDNAFPSPRSILFAALAGVSGSLGLGFFYRGLTLGNIVLVAPTGGVIGAAIPVMFNGLTGNLPTPFQALGFGAALAGIWLASQSPTTEDVDSRRGLGLAILAGIGFGGFLTLITFVDTNTTFAPLVVAKLASLLTALLLLGVFRKGIPKINGNPVALLAGICESGANIFYLLGSRLTRLDVVAVLGSLYPAITVILAWLILKEKISHRQWLGVTLCLFAIVLITF